MSAPAFSPVGHRVQATDGPSDTISGGAAVIVQVLLDASGHEELTDYLKLFRCRGVPAVQPCGSSRQPSYAPVTAAAGAAAGTQSLPLCSSSGRRDTGSTAASSNHDGCTKKNQSHQSTLEIPSTDTSTGMAAMLERLAARDASITATRTAEPPQPASRERAGIPRRCRIAAPPPRAATWTF